ncbi:MAG: hypothetical protein Q4C73_10065 [Eubacteriales bacterium]|nr:hypothetical protein [Eubacteriales bacterium]
MRLWKRTLALALGAGLLAAAPAGNAMAAEDRTKITSISLTVDSSIEAGEDSGDVSITANDSSYRVTDVDVVNDEGDWVSGDVPRVEITLEADDDYYFYSMSSSKVKLRGDDATYVSSHREDKNSTLVLTIKLDALEGSMEIESTQWEDDESTTATWEKADGAKSYQVRLYRGSSSVGETVSTTGTSWNFADRITREGEYYFKVRAVNQNNKKGDWYESDSIYVDEYMLADIKAGHYGSGGSGSGTSSTPGGPGASQGQWIQNSTGWWYRYSNGSYPANGWMQINNIWYCFDSAGYMRTGWIQSGSTWYYCDPSSGAMRTGWILDGNTWYFCNESGVMQTGWVQVNGTWYYCDPSSGAMWADRTTPDNHYVGSSGAMVR